MVFLVFSWLSRQISFSADLYKKTGSCCCHSDVGVGTGVTFAYFEVLLQNFFHVLSKGLAGKLFRDKCCYIADNFNRTVFAYWVRETLSLRELTITGNSLLQVENKFFALTVAQYVQKVNMAMSEWSPLPDMITETL